MAEIRGFFGGQCHAQLPFHLQRIGAAVRNTEAARDADTVGIADIGRLVVDIAEDEVGGLAAHAGQGGELFHGGRHIPLIFFCNDAAGFHDVFGLRGEAAAFYIGIKDFRGGFVFGVVLWNRLVFAGATRGLSDRPLDPFGCK